MLATYENNLSVVKTVYAGMNNLTFVSVFSSNKAKLITFLLSFASPSLSRS